ncbi:MAG: GFA family protein [Alphaproteobacteria bacterium]|nr:GFA family protein [Alphaproteobacteria bacterium]
MTASDSAVTHKGGCHCGAVAFEVDAPTSITVHACNCSMCEKVGFVHLIVPAERFKLLTREDALATYTFNTGVAQHLFCKTCGVKSFYVPRSNPDGYSVNIRCLDQSTFNDIRVEPFDGQNWEDHAGHLAHLSQI